MSGQEICRMNIAICDDNIYLGGKIEALVDKAFAGNTFEYNCEVFSSGDSLLAFLEKNPFAFQMYLLDIEMEGTDGLKTAAQIRLKDSDAVIIFMTCHAELMPEAFKVLAFQYVVKPFDDEKTISIILSAILYLQNQKSLYQYIIRKRAYTLYLSQIEYIESIGRKIILHTIDGTKQEYYGTLKEAARKTANIAYIQLHNSYIINMRYLDMAGGNSVIMRSGIEITISNKYHDSFHKAYRKFVLMQTGF